MRAELANVNDCVVPLLSRAVVKLWWYYYSDLVTRLYILVIFIYRAHDSCPIDVSCSVVVIVL